MKIEQSENITIITSKQDNISLFLENVSNRYNSYKNTNIIINIPKTDKLSKSEIVTLNKLSTKHKKEKKSFVVVVNEHFDFNQTTAKVMFVPTLQEAKDVIEMEEIERDLGF